MQTITKHFINGEFIQSHGTDVFEVRDPKNNELIGRTGNARVRSQTACKQGA